MAGAMSDSFGVGLVHSGEAHTTSTAFSNKKADMPKLHAAKPSYEGAKQREYEFMMSLRHEIQVPQHKPKPIEDAPLTPRQVQVVITEASLNLTTVLQAENLALRHQKLVHYGQRAGPLYLACQNADWFLL